MTQKCQAKLRKPPRLLKKNLPQKKLKLKAKSKQFRIKRLKNHFQRGKRKLQLNSNNKMMKRTYSRFKRRKLRRFKKIMSMRKLKERRRDKRLQKRKSKKLLFKRRRKLQHYNNNRKILNNQQHPRRKRLLLLLLLKMIKRKPKSRKVRVKTWSNPLRRKRQELNQRKELRQSWMKQMLIKRKIRQRCLNKTNNQRKRKREQSLQLKKKRLWQRKRSYDQLLMKFNFLKLIFYQDFKKGNIEVAIIAALKFIWPPGSKIKTSFF